MKIESLRYEKVILILRPPPPPNTTVLHGMKFGISKAEEAPPAASISIPCVFLIGKGSWEFLSLGVLER